MSTTPLTVIDLRDYRARLQGIAERVSLGVAQLTAEAMRPTGSEATFAEATFAEAPAHDPTATCSEADEEVARSVLLSEEQILSETQAALARLDANAFGRCERCGRGIAKARLDAVPYARNCIRCARAAESAETF